MKRLMMVVAVVASGCANDPCDEQWVPAAEAEQMIEDGEAYSETEIEVVAVSEARAIPAKDAYSYAVDEARAIPSRDAYLASRPAAVETVDEARAIPAQRLVPVCMIK